MPDPNPYAPPADFDAVAMGTSPPNPVGRDVAPSEGAPTYKLYTPGHATLAAFLGTPAAGLYLISVNRRRMGHAQAANTTLFAGLVATIVILVAAFALPDAVGRFLPIAATIAVAQYAKQDTPLLDGHVGRGGEKESGWKAAGIGFLSMIVFVGIVFFLVLVTGIGG